MNNYAYTTLLGSDDYLYPVLGLYHSLQYTKCIYPLVVIVTDNVSISTIKVLEQFNITYKVFPDLRQSAHSVLSQDDDFGGICGNSLFQIIMMNKFYMFDLKEYDKLCYFDGDIIVRCNVDFCFNYNTPAAKVLCYGDKDNNPHTAGEHMIINPQDYNSKDIIMRFGILGFDEEVLRTLYPIWQITNIELTDNQEYIFHSHAHCCKYRYWNDFEITSIETLFEAVDAIIEGKFDYNEGKCIAIDLSKDFFKAHEENLVIRKEFTSSDNVLALNLHQNETVSLYNNFMQKIQEQK